VAAGASIGAVRLSGVSRHAIGALHKPGHSQRHNLPHVGIGETVTHFQHRPHAFQKNAPALERHSLRSGRDGRKLAVTTMPGMMP
jgi:hypothetical protein